MTIDINEENYTSYPRISDLDLDKMAEIELQWIEINNRMYNTFTKDQMTKQELNKVKVELSDGKTIS